MFRPGKYYFRNLSLHVDLPPVLMFAVEAEEEDTGHDANGCKEAHGDEEPLGDLPQDGHHDCAVLRLLPTRPLLVAVPRQVVRRDVVVTQCHVVTVWKNNPSITSDATHRNASWQSANRPYCRTQCFERRYFSSVVGAAPDTN